MEAIKEKVNNGEELKKTGSTIYQIENLEEKIKKEKIHLLANKKDFPCKRSLLKKISHKKKLLVYLKKEEASAYRRNLKII